MMVPARLSAKSDFSSSGDPRGNLVYDEASGPPPPLSVTAHAYDALPELVSMFSAPLATSTPSHQFACTDNCCEHLPTVAGAWDLGRDRHAETGLDYFGARYYGSAQGRFTSPDAPFADQHPEDPQSWNLYTYGRNNPLRYFDPTGMDAVSKEACAQDSTCVSVQLNVVLDKNADIYDSKGKLLPEYQKQVDSQVAKAQSDYGEFNIHLEVSQVSGAVTNDHGNLSISSGAVAGALNVAVTDSNQLGNSAVTGESGIQNGVAATYLNMNNIRPDTLSHELSHQFAGDTAFQIPNIRVPGLNQLVGFAIGLGANTYFDYRNDYTRAFPGGVPWTAPRPVTVPGFPANWGMFNRGARRWAMW